MNTVERAAEVIGRSRHESAYDVRTRGVHRVPAADAKIAQAIADAGLLLSDDPLHPPMLTEHGQPFRDWLDFVDRVARPMLVADVDYETDDLMALYRKASPYFICTALVLAASRAASDADRAVLDAADRWYDADFDEGDEVDDAIDELSAAVRARRKQP